MRVMDVAVIGAGASGMAAAITALQMKQRVMIFEANDRIGKKILATGNGKCNFTHEGILPEFYHCDDIALLEQVLSEYPTEKIVQWFENLGMQVREKNGYYYPYSEQATTVLDLLRTAIEEYKGVIVTENPVHEIKFQNGLFVFQKGKEKIGFHRCILATGSFAGKFLSDKIGTPYEAAKSKGLKVTKLYPSLTKGISKEADMKLLSGVRSEAVLSLYSDGNFIKSEQGEVQFTPKGLSGIVFFQLSGMISEALSMGKHIEVHLNLMPEKTLDELKVFLINRYKKFAYRKVEDFFLGIWNKKVMFFLCKRAGIELEKKAEQYQVEELFQVFKLALDCPIKITETASIEEAQVCRGGVTLQEVDENMSVKSVPGLFLCGEVLNVDGLCGGYNLHWAWASGIEAGKSASIKN